MHRSLPETDPYLGHCAWGTVEGRVPLDTSVPGTFDNRLPIIAPTPEVPQLSRPDQAIPASIGGLSLPS
jgi:hypothetical protein